jgi:hypothetical protein
MKKFFSYLVAITVIAIISLASVEVYAGWELYDNFDSGFIDPTRWDIDDSSATITIEGGKAKFEHQPGFPEDSSWLIFKISPETIKAVRVTVMVESYTGDVIARIGGRICKVGNDYVFNQIAVKADGDRIFGKLYVNEWGTSDWLYDLYLGRFKYPLDIIGNPFTIATTFFNPRNVIYFVGGLGRNTVNVFEDIGPTDNYFKGIGTRSKNGDGPCVVYFDDVYVLK